LQYRFEVETPMPSKADIRFVQRVNKERVAQADMEAVLSEIATIPAEDRCFTAGAAAMMRALPNERSGDYRAALMFRLEAMQHYLTDHPEVAGLSKLDTDGGILIPEWTIAAACKCAMHPDDGNRVKFEPEEFRLAALNATEPEGSA
jgi:hypothetical protein